jgi:hypothetical protein
MELDSQSGKNHLLPRACKQEYKYKWHKIQVSTNYSTQSVSRIGASSRNNG